jgi:hypothetical protein
VSLFWLIVLAVLGFVVFSLLGAGRRGNQMADQVRAWDEKQRTYKKGTWCEVEIEAVGSKRNDWVIQRAIGPDRDTAVTEALRIAAIMHGHRVGEIRLSGSKVTKDLPQKLTEANFLRALPECGYWNPERSSEASTKNWRDVDPVISSTKELEEYFGLDQLSLHPDAKRSLEREFNPEGTFGGIYDYLVALAKDVPGPGSPSR